MGEQVKAVSLVEEEGNLGFGGTAERLPGEGLGERGMHERT